MKGWLQRRQSAAVSTHSVCVRVKVVADLSIGDLSQIRTLPLDALNDDGTLVVAGVVNDALHNVILKNRHQDHMCSRSKISHSSQSIIRSTFGGTCVSEWWECSRTPPCVQIVI